MTVNQTSLLLQFSEKRLRPHLYTPTFQLVDLREDHSSRPEEETPKITKADIQQLVSWIKNQDLMIHTYWLDLKGWRAEQANGTPCLPRDTKRAANKRLANTGPNIIIMVDPHKSTALSNSQLIACLTTTWKLISSHCSNQDEHDHISERHWK